MARLSTGLLAGVVGFGVIAAAAIGVGLRDWSLFRNCPRHQPMSLSVKRSRTVHRRDTP
jgi:type IV secretory pathway TrbD component